MKPFKFKLFNLIIEFSKMTKEDQVNDTVKQILGPFEQPKSLAQQVDDYAIKELEATIQENTGFPSILDRVDALLELTDYEDLVHGLGLQHVHNKVEELFEDNGRGKPR